jgi:hypothetical protein
MTSRAFVTASDLKELRRAAAGERANYLAQLVKGTGDAVEAMIRGALGRRAGLFAHPTTPAK